jgi:DNA-binding NtrC family response regulator
LIDITMPVLGGIELLEIIRQHSPQTECVMVTAVDEARVAVECLRRGAYDYLVKPISKENLISSVNRALERRRLFDILTLAKQKRVPRIEKVEAFKPIVTRSEFILRILKEAELHAVSDVPILVTGETGTGKELLARAIHDASRRSQGVFTPINMDALTPSLFDAAFFGHTKGAFTGADSERIGFLENSHKGTLFLDEIGNLPVEMQGKLLRVLQDGEFIKIGTNRPQKTDVRFIAATNKDLDVLIAKNLFRKDLYYRLRGGWLHLPPLRERKEDLPLLMSRFLEDICGPGGIDVEEEALTLLMNYDFPGNVRELKSVLQSAVNLSQGGTLSVRCLPEQLRKKAAKAVDFPRSLETKALSEVEKDHILQVYEETGRNKAQTAKLLRIGLNTLRRKLESYGIS